MRNALIGTLMLAATVAPALAQAPAPAPAPATTAAMPATGPQFVSVKETSTLSSNLVGLSVTNASGQSIGEIKDVVVEPSAVAVSYDPGAQKWHAKMNATADQLKAALAFTYQGKWKS